MLAVAKPHAIGDAWPVLPAPWRTLSGPSGAGVTGADGSA